MKYHNGFTLAEFFSPHFKNNRQLAFTLAEVLITLGIIGIVAAKTYNKKKQIDNSLLNNGQFVLTDGSLILIENWNIGTLYISVDVNGIKNRPNIWGQDLFTFQLMANGKLVPMGMDGTRYLPKTHCSQTSSDTYNGVACTHKALTDKNFWKNLP